MSALTKEDSILIHQELARLKIALEVSGALPESATLEYAKLNVTPVSVHRSRDAHIHAFLLLARLMANHLAPKMWDVQASRADWRVRP